MDLILSLIPGGGITALFAALVAFLAWSATLFVKGRAGGKADERAKQDARNAKAIGDRLEMHREATAAEREATSLTDDEAKRKAQQWARKP